MIPHIVSVDIKKRETNSKKFSFPLKCPFCGSQTIKEYNFTTKKKDAVRRCSTEGFECEKVAIEKIKHFVSKEAFNIDGLGKKIVENFYNLKLIRLPQDIFNLDYNKIEKMEGWGNKSISNLRFSINAKKNVSFERFIYSLGIRHIGFENAKLISKDLKSPKNLLTLIELNKIDDLLNIDGIGDTQINSIKNFFRNDTNFEIFKNLFNILKIENSLETNEHGPLRNKTFMLTGKLEGMSRAEAKSLIEQNSGTIISNVNSKLNYLVIGKKPTKRKVDAANAMKIKLLSQKDLIKMLNKTS